MSRHVDLDDYTDAEKRAFARIVDIGGRRTRREITAQQALSRAVKSSIEPAIAALEGDPLLLDLFAVLELVSTKANAARLATHPLRPEGVEAAIARRLAEEGKASAPELGESDRPQS